MYGRKGFGLVLKAAAAGLLAIGISLLLLSQASAQDPAVSVERATVAFGETGTVDLSSVDIDPPGLGAWEIGIRYDPSVATPTGCEELGGSVCNINFSPNRVQVTGANSGGHEGDTVLARISFSCNSDAGATPLAPVVDVFADATPGEPNPITPDLEHGSITCVEAGDPAPTATRRPTEEEPTEPTEPTEPPVETDGPPSEATATPTTGPTKLPEVGSGGSGGAGLVGWLTVALAAVGLAAIGSIGALRLRSRSVA